MNNLSSLCISGLRNISDVEYAKNTNLASKPNLHKLILNFQEVHSIMGCRDKELHLAVSSSKNAKNENDGKIQDVVLSSLQPHGNLTELAILNYGGRIFPSWLLNPLLPKLTTLTLNFWIEPNFLPPFGQLPHLKFLDISSNNGVRNVGNELNKYSLLTKYGSSKQPKKPNYPSLEVLSMKNMLNLEEWQAHDCDFPCLKKLVIDNCLKLQKIATISMEVRDLLITECNCHELQFSSESKIQNIFISNCPELILIYWKEMGLSIREVTFEYCPKLKLLACPSIIKKLKINECGFREIMFHAVSENLTISNCTELFLINWSDGSLIYVREVNIEYCPKLENVIIPVGTLKLKIHESGFREIIFRSVSENLTISNCVELISIKWSVGGLNSVEEVSFKHCPKFNLPTIPIGIKKLKIAYSNIQEIIFPLQSRIQMLHVFHCPLLTSIHWVKRETLFHTNLLFEDCPELQEGLKNMRISYCPILQFPVNNVLHSITQRAEIYNCPRMDLGKRYVYQKDTTIKVLNLFGNNEIRLSSVNSPIPLQKNPFTLFLTKENLLEVESLTCAPIVGLSSQQIMLNLPSLVIIEILRCRKVISVTGLVNLINLKRLSLSYCPELCNWNDKTLPLSLEFLELDSCDKLRSLPLLSVQNHSNTLNVLVIKKCPRLGVLEGFHGLMKLKNVDIRHCRNISISPATESLQFMPHITIRDCPLMKDWCQKNRITYYELNPVENSQDDREAEQESSLQESAGST
ncbi:uncharacterized protein LOC144554272 isoform X2 [Carex rostrata]